MAWALVVYGLTLVVTTSWIFAPLRALAGRSRIGAAFIGCPMCVGWWVGVLVAVALPELAPVRHGTIGVLACGFHGSATSALIGTLAHAIITSRGVGGGGGLTTTAGKTFAPPRTAPPCATCGDKG
jgi:hypothetical protein